MGALAVLVATAVALASSAAPALSPRAADTETFDLQPGVTTKQQHTASTEFTGDGTKVEISGTITQNSKEQASANYVCIYDAFYSLCNSKGAQPTAYPNVYMGNVGQSNTAPFEPPNGTLPPYSTDHTYTFTSGTTGRFYFWAYPRGESAATDHYTFSGHLTVSLTPLGEPVPTDEKTAPAPDPGQSKTYGIPKPRSLDLLDGDIGLVGPDGRPVGEPFVTAIAAYTRKGEELCWILALHDPDSDIESYPGPDERFEKCLVAVVKVLQRYDQIHANDHARATAAANHCFVFGNPAARRLLRLSCRPTAAGGHVVIRVRKRGTSLRKLLGRRAPKLIVRRSSLDSGKAYLKTRLR